MPPFELLRFLDHYFAVDRYPVTEQGGVYHASDRLIRRVGLALEPDPGLKPFVIDQRLDVLWLHRPWQLTEGTLPPGIGVLYHHLPFDETLTMGFNQPLADALGMPMPEELGYKQAGADTPRRAIGMVGNVTAQTVEAWLNWTTQTFGGYDQAEPGRRNAISRIAVVGAIT